jgi:DNA topoisomerase-1
LKLVIVESPAKAKTIGRFLGKGYKVAASFGHVRDLPSSAEEIPDEHKGKDWARMAVDVDHGFAPIYVVPPTSRKHIAELKKLIKDADEVVLATDEDREGESISWHLLEVLQPKVPVKRIAFHEITAEAIQDALDNPRDLNQALVKAQESRRVLDRLFGYSLSPVLWKKVRPKLSAGRVQSVAVRLVVEREEERRRFKKAEYFSIEAHLKGGAAEFDATLVAYDDKRIVEGKDFDPETGQLLHTGKKALEVVWLDRPKAGQLAKALEQALPWTVSVVEQKETRQRPYPPFMTSTLQQAASAILGFSPRKTMQVAQKLYEGVDFGGGEREGVITYMRTDSLTLSTKALAEAERVIKSKYGEKYHDGVRVYSNKSKSAQEAHEAIRPTHLSRTAESLKGSLNEDEVALYRIIWNRTIASQMTDAQLLKTRVEFDATVAGKKAVLRANGSVVVFPGYLRVADVSQKDTELPPVKEGQKVGKGEAIQLAAIEPESHETEPPARYTEASLIKRLEEEGIGRPSTYAPTMSTIEARGYVERRGKALVPTFLAVAVIQLLRDHFPEYVDIGFTARMEDALDDIANGDQDSLAFLKEFYRGGEKFGHGLEPQIAHELPKIEFPAIPLGQDPKTKAPIVVRIGRSAPYLQRGEGGEGNTAPVPADTTFENLNVERAVELFEQRAKGDEPIGKHPATNEAIYVLLGPYGPYVQLGALTKDKKKKPKRASLPKGMKPGDVDVATAVRLLSLPRDLGAHPETNTPIVATVGRFGPYIKCGDDSRSLRKDDDVYTVTRERALELLAQPKAAGRGGKKVLVTLGNDPETGKTIQVCEGKWGPYITNGVKNAKAPKDVDPAAITMEQAREVLAAAPGKGGKSAGRRKAPAKAKTAAKAKSAGSKPARRGRASAATS